MKIRIFKDFNLLKFSKKIFLRPPAWDLFSSPGEPETKLYFLLALVETLNKKRRQLPIPSSIFDKFQFHYRLIAKLEIVLSTTFYYSSRSNRHLDSNIVFPSFCCTKFVFCLFCSTYKIIAEEQFKFEVNEISWNNTNDLFFLTNGHGCINILSYPELKQIQTLNAHPANCICIKFDPTGQYIATGSADALVSLWDLNELVCVRAFHRLDWPVCTLSFSHDGKLLASGSEDLFIDVALVETGEKVCEIPCTTRTFTVAWHPSEYLLAFACDDKDKHDRDAGTIKLYGLPTSTSSSS